MATQDFRGFWKIQYLVATGFYISTSKSLKTRVRVTRVAQGFQSSCLCTLHNIQNFPKHRTRQSPIRHLGHKQPNAQPVWGSQIINKWFFFLVKRESSVQFLTFCFAVHVKQLWGRDGHIPAVVFPKTENVSQIHQHQLNSHTQPSNHWHNTLSFWGKIQKTALRLLNVTRCIMFLFLYRVNWPYHVSYSFN